MGRRDGTLAALLHGQGHGTRKECERMVRAGRVEIGLEAAEGVAWRKAEDPSETPGTAGLHLKVDGAALPYREALFLALHKPAGYECSHAPSHHASVFDLLPRPFVARGIQAVGRLDADTTGLLLLSDSGDFNHFFTSPRRHVIKKYRVETRHPISADQVRRLAEGVELRQEDGPTLPATVEILAERTALVAIQEGRYHQVKRMFAAVGNRVDGIHRVAIGGLALEDSLAPGAWRFLSEADLELLGYRGG